MAGGEKGYSCCHTPPIWEVHDAVHDIPPIPCILHLHRLGIVYLLWHGLPGYAASDSRQSLAFPKVFLDKHNKNSVGQLLNSFPCKRSAI